MQQSRQADIFYLHHSGFCVVTAGHVLVFDYIEDPSAALSDIFKNLQGRQVVVFASHSHGDHFSLEIFKWVDHCSDIKYVLSHDITHNAKDLQITAVYPGCAYRVGALEVDTLESTDIGVAFLVRCDGLNIYHAGDLNWWHWEGEPDNDNETMAKAYKEQILSLKGKELDLAFVPVDPRLGEQYHLGLSLFLQEIGAKMVFPMHFGNNYSVFSRLKRDLPTDTTKVVVEMTPTQHRYILTSKT